MCVCVCARCAYDGVMRQGGTSFFGCLSAYLYIFSQRSPEVEGEKLQLPAMLICLIT